MPRPALPRPRPCGRRRLADRIALVAAVAAPVLISLPAGTAAAVPVGSPAVSSVRPAAAASGATDPFYLPPSPLPPGAPGTLIRWRRTTLGKLGGVVDPASASAFQVMYLSTSNSGAPIAITGTVLVPTGVSTASMPIVGYAPSTHGIGDQCAASSELVAGGDTDLLNINDALRRGWAVADGDYQGLGTPGDHTYVVGRVEGHSVLDAVRAAQRLRVAGLPAAGPVALWGYSQGGGAVAWAAQLAPTYAPELKIKGSAAGGTPADLSVVAGALNNGPGFAYLLMAAVGLNTAYPELKLNNYLNDAGRAALVDLPTRCVNDALLHYAFGKISDYTTSNPLDRADWQARVAQQKIGLVRPSAPVLLYRGLQDEFIPYSQAVQLAKDWCARGARVSFQSFLGEHVSTFLSGAPDAESFLADRFAGKTAPSSC